MDSPSDWMIYGANGYTGRLIAEEAIRRGARPILAGRSSGAIAQLAHRLDCPSRVFALDRADEIATHLAGMKMVLHCAGPFSATATPMMDACLQARCSYLDITGEIDVIEAAATRHQAAREAGITLMPAVGFDVVPSDCLAATLAAELPGATQLQLAFTAFGGLSPGTTKTMVENLPRGGRARINGRIQFVPAVWKTLDIPFRSGTRSAVTIAWGDVASAYYSTGIPNIEVYLATPPAAIRQMRRMSGLLKLTAPRVVQALIKRWVTWRVKGPSADQLQRSHSSLWGRVRDDQGHVREATLDTPGGYPLTVTTSLAIVERVRRGDRPEGFATPSRAYGANFIQQFDGVSFQWITPAPLPQRV